MRVQRIEPVRNGGAMSNERIVPGNRRIKIAVVGCGRISEKHFEAIKAHDKDLLLVGVCDTNPEMLARSCELFGVPGYSDIRVMLKEEDIDLVVLCTPSGLHSAQTLRCAHEGYHVMTEKPMATRWKDGLRMVKTCDEAGVRLFVVKQNRHNSTLKLLRKAVQEGRFGKIFLVQINVFWTRPQAYYDSAEWRGTWEFDGGALMNQASHYIDLLDWLIGPVESIQAMTGTLQRDIEVEDTAVMNVRWRSSALGSVSVTMLTYPRNMEGSITIIGENGTVKLGGVAVNEVQHWEFADGRSEEELVAQASYETSSVYGFGHSAYYANVAKTLRGTAEPETDGREGLHSLELLIAAYLSARDGGKISLPLEY